MGFISELAKAAALQKASFPGANQGRETWRQIFGTDKETSRDRPKPTPESYDSNISSANSIKRLLVAMRSNAPGGWSDDRYTQSQKFTGVTYVAVHRISQQLQQAEFQVFEKDPDAPDGKRPIDRHHPSYALVELLEKPNPEDSFGDLMYQWSLQRRLTGSALTWMVPNKLEKPMELYPIPTAMAIPMPVMQGEFPYGYYQVQPVYPYGPFSSYPTPISAVGARIPSNWMMKFKYHHPLLRYDGYSPLTALRLQLDELESIDRSRWYLAKRKINPSAVLDMSEMEGQDPLPEEEIDRLHAEFEAQLMGPENQGRLFVPPPGTKLQAWDGDKDIQDKEGWGQLLDFSLGGGFGITKPAAGMVEDSSYSTLFATMKQLNLITLDPDCSYIGAKLTRFLAPFYGENLIVEVRCKRIDDPEIKGNKLKMLMDAKAITKNEVRQELEMPMTQEEWGEEIAGLDTAEQAEAEKDVAQADKFQMQANEDGGDEDQEKKEIEKSRPTPGKLSQGALGPRKFLNGFHRNGVHR